MEIKLNGYLFYVGDTYINVLHPTGTSQDLVFMKIQMEEMMNLTVEEFRALLMVVCDSLKEVSAKDTVSKVTKWLTDMKRN